MATLGEFHHGVATVRSIPSQLIFVVCNHLLFLSIETG